MSWSRRFDDPIPTPRGPLVTLRDAGEYIRALPHAEQKQPHWEDATQALLLVVESKTGPTMFARIGMMQALAHGQPRPEHEQRRKTVKPVRLIR